MAEVSDAIGREFQIMLRADIYTCPAPYTFLAGIHLHRLGRDALRVVAPYASKRTPLQADIVGTWKLTEVKTSQSGSYISWPFEATYASFNSDGTYYDRGYFGYGSGTWKAKGNKVSTYVDDELFITYEILSVSGNNAELKMIIDGEAIWIKCKKQ